MKASLTNYRQAPRKMRLVANSLKGKKVPEVLATLTFMPKKAAEPLKKLIESAVANARVIDAGVDVDNLIVRTITVDKGMTMLRFTPRAFGRASPIRKMSSHVRIELAPAFPKKGTEKGKSAVETPHAEAAPKAKKPRATKAASKKASKLTS